MNESIAKQLTDPVVTKLNTKRIAGLESSGVKVHGILLERLVPSLRLGLGGSGVFGELSVDGTVVIVQVPPGKEGTEGWAVVLIPLARFSGVAVLR